MLQGLFRFAEVDDGRAPEVGGQPGTVPAAALPQWAEAGAVRPALRELLKGDADRLRELSGQDFPEWTV